MGEDEETEKIKFFDNSKKAMFEFKKIGRNELRQEIRQRVRKLGIKI